MYHFISQAVFLFWGLFLDLVHDLSLGPDVQDLGERVPAISACGNGPADENGLH